jgi:hypothetical protein
MGLKLLGRAAESPELVQVTVGPSPSATYMRISPLFMCEVS